MSSHRSSDRWITPGVVAILILAGTIVVLAILAAVTYLTARGYDPEPIVQLVGTLVAAAAASGNFLLSLVKRRSETKVERYTGRDLPAKVDELAAKVDAALWVDINGTQQLPPVPPPAVRDTRRHPFAPADGGGPGGDGEFE